MNDTSKLLTNSSSVLFISNLLIPNFLFIAYAKEDLPELKVQTSSALKAVKNAWNALANVNLQVKNLQQDLEKNQDVVQEMKYMLHEVKNGNSTHQIPAKFFVDLLEEFEERLNQYKKRIEEIEGI